jgi:hypothetical protein
MSAEAQGDWRGLAFAIKIRSAAISSHARDHKLMFGCARNGTLARPPNVENLVEVGRIISI